MYEKLVQHQSYNFHYNTNYFEGKLLSTVASELTYLNSFFVIIVTIQTKYLLNEKLKHQTNITDVDEC